MYNLRCNLSNNVQNKHQRKTIRRYVNEKMKESLIAGVPQIVSSKSSFRRAVKSLMFLFCTAGFFYQSFVFVESFLKYDTIQNMRIEYPTKFMAPAVTICNKNRIPRTRFCDLSPEKCSFGSWVPLNINYTYNSSNAFLEKYGPHSPRDFFTDDRRSERSICHTEINGGIEKCKKKDFMFIHVPSKGLPYKCITIYSLLDKPNEEPRKLRRNDEVGS